MKRSPPLFKAVTPPAICFRGWFPSEQKNSFEFSHSNEKRMGRKSGAEKEGRGVGKWQYVVDPDEKEATLFRLDPKEQCLCTNCVMNSPKTIDLEASLKRWSIPCRGDFKTDSADVLNTLLILVSVHGSSNSVEDRKDQYSLLVDDTLSLVEFNKIIAHTSFGCSCCCDFTPLPPILFLGGSNACLTPCGNDSDSHDTLEDLFATLETTTLGMLLHKMGAIKARKAEEWNNLQMMYRVLWVEAYFLPIETAHDCNAHSSSNENGVIRVPLIEEKGNDRAGGMFAEFLTPGERKLLHWFKSRTDLSESSLTKHKVQRNSKKDNCKCIECSQMETPLAFAWYSWARMHLFQNPNPRKLETLLHFVIAPPVKSLIIDYQWVNVASLAQEYYTIIHLAHALFEEYSTATLISCVACIEEQTKPKSKKKSKKKAKKAKAKKTQHTESTSTSSDPATKSRQAERKKTAKRDQKSGSEMEVTNRVDMKSESDDVECVECMECNFEIDEEVDEEVEAFISTLLSHHRLCNRKKLPKYIFSSIQDVMKEAIAVRNKQTDCTCACHH